jgi:protein TonB
VFSDKFVSFFIAVTLHGAAFTAGNAMFSTPAQYGIEQGDGAVEVNLVAAPPAASSESLFLERSMAEKKPLDTAKETDEVFMDESITQKKIEEIRKIENLVRGAAEPVKETGDGSSVVPGKDATTLYSSASAQTRAKPNYLKNPAPTYPEAARRAGQEGLALLSVSVSRDGVPEEVEIRKSSGFYLLDEAAVRAVRKWKFQPAGVGGIPIASRVEIPIRFRLDE